MAELLSKVDENGAGAKVGEVFYETYAGVHEKNVQLADKIEARYRESGLKIGKVAVPARGSWLLASDLTEWFGVGNDQLQSFSVQSYSGQQQESPGQLVIARTMPSHEEIEGEHFLVLDEVWESGHTLNFIARYLKIMEAASVCVATLYFKPGHNMITETEPNRPDVHVAEREDWIDFPWERARRLRQPTPEVSQRTHERTTIWPDEYLEELAAAQAA